MKAKNKRREVFRLRLHHILSIRHTTDVLRRISLSHSHSFVLCSWLFLAQWRVYRFAVYCVLGHSDAPYIRTHTFMVLQPSKATNVFRFHHGDEEVKKKARRKTSAHNAIEMYAKQRQNLCHRNKDISMTTYFSSAQQNKKKYIYTKRKQRISCRVVCALCRLSSVFCIRTSYIVGIAYIRIHVAIVSFCESIEHRLVVPVPVVLYQFLVFGSFIICAAQCAYCMRECVSVFFVSLRPNETNKRTGSEQPSRTASKWIVFITKLCVFSGFLFQAIFVWHHSVPFFFFFSSISKLCNYVQ